MANLRLRQCYFFQDEGVDYQKTPNVIIFGTDSVSRINMERHMPKTYKRLQQIDGYLDFVGYNKLADNTDPNMLALLTGVHPFNMYSLECHNSTQVKVISNLLRHVECIFCKIVFLICEIVIKVFCNKYLNLNSTQVSYDKCPFLWNSFSDRDYVTVYGEDAPAFGTFHFEKPGFVEQPTDFYNRAAYQLSEKTISRSGGQYYWHFKSCQGPTPSIKVIHNYALNGLDFFKVIIK